MYSVYGARDVWSLVQLTTLPPFHQRPGHALYKDSSSCVLMFFAVGAISCYQGCMRRLNLTDGIFFRRS
jgi:hypothetical protein